MKSQEKDENKKEHEPFFIVPSRVFDEGLNPYELSVLFYLIMRSDNETHTCFPSEKGIAKACGMSHPTVTRVIKSLETKSIIKVKRQYAPTKNGTNRQTANLYTLLICEITPHNSKAWKRLEYNSPKENCLNCSENKMFAIQSNSPEETCWHEC